MVTGPLTDFGNGPAAGTAAADGEAGTNSDRQGAAPGAITRPEGRSMDWNLSNPFAGLLRLREHYVQGDLSALELCCF